MKEVLESMVKTKKDPADIMDKARKELEDLSHRARVYYEEIRTSPKTRQSQEEARRQRDLWNQEASDILGRARDELKALGNEIDGWINRIQRKSQVETAVQRGKEMVSKAKENVEKEAKKVKVKVKSV